MTTVINNQEPRGERVAVVDRTDSSGWIVAVIILLAIIGGVAFLWSRYSHNVDVMPGSTINVSVPAPKMPEPSSPQTSGGAQVQTTPTTPAPTN